MSKKLLIFLTILLGASIMIFWGLGNGALTDYDEATYGHVVDETTASGQWGTLKHSVSGNWFEKPPLYFWLAMVSQNIFPDPEFTLRFPSALSGLIAIILVMLIAWRVSKNYYSAALSGAILATTPIFIEAARQVRLDVPVTAAILFSFYCFLRGLKNPRWLVGVGIGAAIGFMFKSVIGFFIFPIIFIWSLAHHQWQWIKNKHLWIGGVLMIAILAPWHIYESLRFGAVFWNDYLLRHVFQRFSSDIVGGASGSQSEYFTFLFLFTAPWIFLFLAKIWTMPQYLKKSDENAKHIIGFFGITIFIFLVFSVAQTKIFYYLIPLFPFLALSIATTYSRWKTIALTLVLAFAIANTVYTAFHWQYYFSINQLVANEEREVGLALLDDTSTKTRVFEYPYRETIRYYSNGRTLHELQNDQALTESFFVIISKPFFDVATFPRELADRLAPVYTGQSIILLRFD